MDKIANLSQQERNDLFTQTASEIGATNAIAEKDFWVVWTLYKMFADDRLNQILMFKGGTSLSKVYDLIGRFSEDVDLILDWAQVTDDNPYNNRSKNKQSKFNEEVNDAAKVYIKDDLLPIISGNLSPLCNCSIDEESDFSINIKYPSVFPETYLRPEILLEIGPLASWTPAKVFEINSYAAEQYPDIFDTPGCHVPTILAERTFWEKATILHHEANRPDNSVIPLRYSRHFYDLAMMAKSDMKSKALNDLELLNSVVDFKKKFYPRGWAKYEEAKPGTLKLLPLEYRFPELRRDYDSMQNMIFAKHLEFDEIFKILKELEDEINSM